ncbi:dihydroorotase [Mycoemilia scoparia]|uniref:dihydroorotase n=1 Tax=Mycoemilia scoparia TaxID=417184 RepID=A0A9W7ZT10_9FUNG|nr:dihydroorotase [Mycoemilia scoparia]
MSHAKTIVLPYASDFHTHLRQGDMMRAVTPLVKAGGVGTALVMPNLTPPIVTGEQAMEYKARLEELAPGVQFIMTLYMNPKLTPEEIHKSAKLGVTGVKVYPSGVTTNSDWGILEFEAYYPVFTAMQEENMVLCLHGECPSDATKNICIMNAEEKFLATLRKLHNDFPKLRIVLEHATTKAAVECVKELGDTVGCTITAHHLSIIVDDWAGQPHNFCKPVAKYPDDREALRQVIKEGHPRFFLGSDSAPHYRSAKQGEKPAAGVFTAPILIPLLATLFEKIGCLDYLENFISNNGRKFYQLPIYNDLSKLDDSQKITLVKCNDNEEFVIPQVYSVESDSVDVSDGGRQIVPFMAGQKLSWKLQ